MPAAGAFYTIVHGDAIVGRGLHEHTREPKSILFSAHSRVTLAKSVSQSLEFLILGMGIKQSYPLPQRAFSGTNGAGSVNIQKTKRTKEIKMTDANADLLVYLTSPCASVFTVLF